MAYAKGKKVVSIPDEEFDITEHKRTLLKNLLENMIIETKKQITEENLTPEEIDRSNGLLNKYNELLTILKGESTEFGIDSIDVDKILENKVIRACAINLEASMARRKHGDN